jgi:hypothetical protein
MAADGAGALWSTATGGAGVTRFDPTTGALRTFTAGDDPAFASSRRTVPSALGGVWLLEGHQVRRFDGERFADVVPTPVELCDVLEASDGALVGVTCPSDEEDSAVQVHRWAGDGWRLLPRDMEATSRFLGLLAPDQSGGVWFMQYGWVGGVVYWDGAGWTVFEGAPAGWGAATASAGGGLWTVGELGLRHLAAAGWTVIPDSGIGSVQSMVEADGVLWVAGTESDPWSAAPGDPLQPLLVARWDGRLWTRLDPAGEPGLAGPPFDSASLATVGGRVWLAVGGGLLLAEGEGWTPVLESMAPASAEHLVAAGPDEAWVVDRGAFWRLNAGRWTAPAGAHLSGTTTADVALAPDGALWAAAGSGLLRFDGARWQQVARAETLTSEAASAAGLAQLAIAPDGAVWVTSVTGRMLRVGEGVSQQQRIPPVVDVQVAPDGTVWGSTGGAWGLGSEFGWRGDDGQWMEEHPWPSDGGASNCAGELAVGPAGVWALRRCWGDTGEPAASQLAHFDGVRWTVHTDADGEPFGAIAGVAATPDGTLVIAAESGLLAHRESGWTRLLPEAYTSVAASPEGDVWLTDATGVYRLDL